MQVKIIAVPAMGGEAMNEQLNVFLRSKKILQVERRLVTPSDGGAYWSFCIHYTEDYSPVKMKERVDYKMITDRSTNADDYPKHFFGVQAGRFKRAKSGV